MVKTRKRNYRREAFHEKIRIVEMGAELIWKLRGEQVVEENDKLRLYHFGEGVRWALKELRKVA